MKVRFARATEFQKELTARVKEYFEANGLPERGLVRMYLKTLVILGWFAASYVALVFFSTAWWAGLLLAVSCGLAVAGIGMAIQHDGCHGGYSNRRWMNYAAGFCMDGVGASSYYWRWKHNVFHHTYTNVTGADDDLETGGLGRLSPLQRRRRIHRVQHLYYWFFYAFLVAKWHLLDDFLCLIKRRVGPHHVPRPRGRDLFVFVGGKLLFATVVFVIPSFFHPFWLVLLFYGAAVAVTGFVLSLVFQLAHCMPEAEFPEAIGDPAQIKEEWMVHQLNTTVDFAPRNWLLTWYVGGLNYQIEHHLFPKVCHVHYPAISKVVREVCEKFEVPYRAHRTFFSAVRSHFRLLRDLGKNDFDQAPTQA